MSENGSIEVLKVAAARTFAKPFGAVIEIALETGETFFIDGRAAPVVADKKPKDADVDCAWRADADVMERVFSGERALESAYVSGRLAVSGDMSVMARLEIGAAR